MREVYLKRRMWQRGGNPSSEGGGGKTGQERKPTPNWVIEFAVTGEASNTLCRGQKNRVNIYRLTSIPIGQGWSSEHYIYCPLPTFLHTRQCRAQWAPHPRVTAPSHKPREASGVSGWVRGLGRSVDHGTSELIDTGRIRIRFSNSDQIFLIGIL